MGQRLNIEIVIDHKTMANCYFHWGAYTSCAADYTLKLIDYYKNHLQKICTDPLIIATKIFECLEYVSYYTGKIIKPGLSKNSYIFMEEKYHCVKFQKAEDRNAGIIGCTEEDIESTRSAEEGRVVINLDSEIIDFDVLFYFSLSDYKEEMVEDGDDFSFFDIPIVSCNFNEIPFEKFKSVYDILMKGTFILADRDLLVAEPIE